MASPFALFRRNQKIMLAVVGIGAMVAFVFLDPLMRYLGGGSRQEQNPVVVETNFGNLTRGELESLKASREIVNRFLRAVTVQVVSAQVGNGLDPRWIDSLAEQRYTLWHDRLMRRSQPGIDEAAVETMVLAKRAEEMGMVISDKAINDLLKQITSDSITSADLEQVIKGLQSSRPISIGKLFEALRTELLASEYQQLFLQSLRDVPPAQRFEYYAQLNRRASAEVMPLAVADFVGQVPDPSNEEVQKLYDKYKNAYPNPESPEPGFKQAPRATFQYFKGSIDALTEKIKPEITEAEIKKYYDDNKEQFRAFDLEKEGATDKPIEGEAQPKTDAEEKETPAGETKPEGDADKPADEKPAEEKAAEEKPAEEKPAESPETPKAEGSEGESAPQASRALASPPVRLVNATLTEDPPTDAQPDTKEASADAATDPAKTETPAAQPPAEEPAAEKPADAPAEKAADEKPVEEKPIDAKQPDAKPAGEAADSAEEKKEEAPRFEPLEKVQDTIRTTLARQKAAERIGTQFEELSAAMRRYTDELDLYSTEKGTNSGAKPPKPLDFAKLAEGKDVQAGELVGVTALEASKADIGKSGRLVLNQRTRMPSSVPFVNFAFSEGLPTHKSETVQDNDNNAYLFWKTQEEGAFVPPLDQIRKQVVLAWKMIKARELAKKRGEEYAGQARALKKPLKELFAKLASGEIVDTGKFSWLTQGNVPADAGGGPPRLNEVAGVDRPGAAFMKRVFSLEAGDVGVAPNEPQDMMYVVRLIDFDPPMDELRDDFARENPSRYMMAATDDQRAMFQAWLSDVNKQAGVHWIRQADARSDEESDEEAGL